MSTNLEIALKVKALVKQEFSILQIEKKLGLTKGGAMIHLQRLSLIKGSTKYK
jgi:hypothetical protein